MREELRPPNDVHRLDRGGAGNGAPAVRAADAAEMRRVHDLRASGDGRDRHAGRERFRRGNEIRNHVEVLDGEESAGAAHAALHFVGNHDDTVLGAELANALQKSLRHRHEAGFALHRLDDHRRDRLRVDLRDERVLELTNADVDPLVGGHRARRAIDVRDRQPHDLGREGTEAALEQPVFAREAEREERAAVKSAFETDDRRPARVLARQLDGVLHGFRAAVGEDRLLRERARRDLVEQLREPHVRLVGGDERAGMDGLPRLIFDRFHDGRRRMADGQHPEPAREIDERVAVDVEDQPALGALDDDVGGAAQACRRRGGAPPEEIARARARNRGVEPDVAHRVRP